MSQCDLCYRRNVNTSTVELMVGHLYGDDDIDERAMPTSGPRRSALQIRLDLCAQCKRKVSMDVGAVSIATQENTP